MTAHVFMYERMKQLTTPTDSKAKCRCK